MKDCRRSHCLRTFSGFCIPVQGTGLFLPAEACFRLVLLNVNGSCPCFLPNLAVVMDMASPLLDSLTRGTQLRVKGPSPVLAIASHFFSLQATAQKYYLVQPPSSNKFQILWIFSLIWPLMFPLDFSESHKLLPVSFLHAVEGGISIGTK